MMQVERFINALDSYVSARITEAKNPGEMSARTMVATAKNTMTNELRLLLASAQEDTRTAAQKASDWRR